MSTPHEAFEKCRTLIEVVVDNWDADADNERFGKDDTRKVLRALRGIELAARKAAEDVSIRGGVS